MRMTQIKCTLREYQNDGEKRSSMTSWATNNFHMRVTCYTCWAFWEEHIRAYCSLLWLAIHPFSFRLGITTLVGIWEEYNISRLLTFVLGSLQVLKLKTINMNCIRHTKSGRLVANVTNLLSQVGIGGALHVCLEGPSPSGSLLRFLHFCSLNF